MKTATTLGGEIKWLNREMGRVMAQSTLRGEVPVRIHSRETDGGGSPEWHPAFERWIDAGEACDVLTCRELRHTHPERSQARFREPDLKMHPQRLKRALRQLRRLAPREYDALYLMVALGYTWEDARSKINADNLTRGKDEYSEAEFLILTVSGSSLLLASY
jgi:hypothetical protein